MSQELRQEVERQFARAVEEQRRNLWERHIENARVQWDRDREEMRRKVLAIWLADTAHKLRRPHETVRLLSIEETYALQDAEIQARELWEIGKIPCFIREMPVERKAEIDETLRKLAGRISDSTVYILRDLSGYFGAIRATSAEVLSRAMDWFDLSGDDQTTVLNASDPYEGIYLTMDTSHSRDFYTLRIWGTQWGQLLSDEQSDWSYERLVGQAIKIHAQRKSG